MIIKIRKENAGDYGKIKFIHDQAFGQVNEGRLIEELRENPGFIEALSLVAEYDEKAVGHILFFPIRIRGPRDSYDTLSLAPMAVLPELQKKGVGSRLIKEGLEVARNLGYESVMVLGHPEYYPRFGFERASQWGIRASFGAPDEAFMALELIEQGLKGRQGVVEYPQEYDAVIQRLSECNGHLSNK